jgi:hypothetical protein
MPFNWLEDASINSKGAFEEKATSLFFTWYKLFWARETKGEKRNDRAKKCFKNMCWLFDPGAMLKDIKINKAHNYFGLYLRLKLKARKQTILEWLFYYLMISFLVTALSFVMIRTK